MVFEDGYNQEIIKAIGRRIAILRVHQKISQEELALVFSKLANMKMAIIEFLLIA